MQPRPISRPTRGSGSIGAETNAKPSSLLDSRPSPMAPILVEPLGRWGHRSSALLFGQIPIERRLRDPQRPADVLDGVRWVAVEHHGVPLLLLVELPAPSALLAAGPGRVEPGPGPRADEVPLELGQGGKHVEDKLVAAGRRVDALLEAAEPALPPAAARCRLPLNNLYILSNELLSSWWIEPGRF